MVEEKGKTVRDCGRGAADERGLHGAAQGAGAKQAALERTEEGEREQRYDDGELEGG